MLLSKIKLSDLKKHYLMLFKSKKDFNTLLASIINYENLNNDDLLLNYSMYKKFKSFYRKYKKGIPIAYITKHIYFYNIDLYIKRKVFIPRIDSEAMIEKIINDNDLNNKNVIDICCGSGALGLSIKKNHNINLTLVEKYKTPLKICKKNSKLFEGVKCVKSDFINILTNINYRFDIIIINPPYIDIDDNAVEYNVRKFEPHTALFAKDKGMWFYKKLRDNLDSIFKINKNALFYVEFGWMQKEELNNLFKNIAKIDFYKDYNNNWRYFTLRKD